MKMAKNIKYIPVSGKVFDKEEINNAIKVAKDGWWTEGEYAKIFENDFKKYLGIKHVSLVNSGSSANLLAVAALTSDLFGERRLRAGDEFITTSVAFPTTVNPGLQYGLKAVFVDAERDSFNIDVNLIEKAITKKTKLLMIAHTLGTPVNLSKLMPLVKKYKLWLIEDCCDALGSKYNNKFLGTFGHISTYSFYPAHHMSCSFNTPIPYLDKELNMESIEKIYEKYVDKADKIKVISFGNNNTINWSTPLSILRHKLGNSKKMFKITTEHGRSVEVTEDHSVFVIDKDTANIIPKIAKQITTDDYVVTTNYIPECKTIEYIDVLEYLKTKLHVGNSTENLELTKIVIMRKYKARNALPINILYYDLTKENLSVVYLSQIKYPEN